MAAINVGDRICLQITILDGGTGNPASGLAITATVYRPDGAQDALVVTEDAAGVYAALYTVSTAGVHRIRWQGPGVAEWDAFTAEP